MKNTLLVLLSLIMIVFSTSAFAKKVEKMPVERDGLYYEHFSTNLANGQYEKYYANGQLKERKTYKNGKIEGISEYYQSDGTRYYVFRKIVDKMPHQNYRKDGLYYEYFSTNLANGGYIRYYTSGQLWSKETFKDGKKVGLHEDYYENGQLWQKATFKDGKVEGLVVRYFENGQLKSRGTYKGGYLDGLFVFYDMDGRLREKCFWVNGKKYECE